MTSSSPPAPFRHRLVDLVVAAAPTIAFLLAQGADASLATSVVAAAAVALAGFVVRLLRHQPLRSAVLGLVVVTICAAAAGLTGEARGFFLVPALIPFVVLAACLVSIAVGRPLTGVLLNRVAGGPPDWARRARLRHVHTMATLGCAGVNVVNAVLQVVFYRADDTVVLGIVHIATGPVFALIAAATLVAARRTSGADPAVDAAGTPTGCSAA